MSKKTIPGRMTSAEFRSRGYDPRRPVKKRSSGEHDIQAALFDVLRLNRRAFPYLRFIYATPNAARRSPQMITIMKREGLTSGVPDICIPMARHGHGGAWIEMKFGSNKMSPEQIDFMEHLVAENFAFKTCYTLDQALEFIEWYLRIELQRPV